MSSKTTKRILDTGASVPKRFKALCQLTGEWKTFIYLFSLRFCVPLTNWIPDNEIESGALEEVKLFYQQQFSVVYNLFLDTLTSLNSTAKTKSMYNPLTVKTPPKKNSTTRNKIHTTNPMSSLPRETNPHSRCTIADKNHAGLVQALS